MALEQSIHCAFSPVCLLIRHHHDVEPPCGFHSSTEVRQAGTVGGYSHQLLGAIGASEDEHFPALLRLKRRNAERIKLCNLGGELFARLGLRQDHEQRDLPSGRFWRSRGERPMNARGGA